MLLLTYLLYHYFCNWIFVCCRWKLLEAQTPPHNLTARQRKMDLAVDKTQPSVFYGHEGKYQGERSGLYKTSYDPYTLQYSMNKDKTAGSELFYTMDSHKDALNNPLGINEDLGELMGEGRTLGGPPGSVAQLNSQPAPHETFGPYDNLRHIQTARLQPNVNTADVKTQERGVTLVESTYGEGFNTIKFLQENRLPTHVRNEPLTLMSRENQDLRRTKTVATLRSGRGVRFNGNVTVGEDAGGQQNRHASALLGNPTMEHPLPRPETSSGVPLRTTRAATNGGFALHPACNAKADVRSPDFRDHRLYAAHPVEVEKSRRTSAGEWAVTKDTAPSTRHSWAPGSSYKNQFPGVNHVDMSYKNDARFQWTAGCGTPRPQTSLIQIQDSFSKSDARQRFHTNFPETNPDLRENLIFGRKHQFDGVNAQILRGTPVV